MNIHQMVITGSFDASGYPLPDAAIHTSLTAESRQQCLDAIAPLLATSDSNAIKGSGGPRLILLPPTESLRLLAMAYYDLDGEGHPKLSHLHLLAVGDSLTTTSVSELPAAPQESPENALHPEEDLSSLHSDLFGFLEPSPPESASSSGEDLFGFLQDPDSSDSGSSGGGSSDEVRFQNVGTDSDAGMASGDAESSSRSESVLGIGVAGLEPHFSGDSDDFDLSLPLPDAPSDSSSQDVTIPESVVSSTDSSADGLFAPSEEDLPEIQVAIPSDTSKPTASPKPRGSGPKNVVARAIRLAEEREHPSDPLSVADFERWSRPFVEGEEDEEDGSSEFDHLVLTGRGIRKRSPDEATESFDRPEDEPEDVVQADSQESSIARETVAKAAAGVAATGITDTARDLLRGLVPETDGTSEAEEFAETLKTDTRELEERESEEPRAVEAQSEPKGISQQEEDLIVVVRGQGGHRSRDRDLEWDPAVALRLLRAHNWQDTDQSLTSYESLPQFLGSETPAIADDVFRNFLICDGEDPLFDDPGDIIPDRWRAMEPYVRRQYFEAILTRILRVYTERTVTGGTNPEPPTLGVVVEPAIASLFFYGVVRLLPKSPIRQSITFSTMEPTTLQLAAGSILGGNCRLLAFWSRDLTLLRKTLAERLNAEKNRGVGFSMVDTLSSQPPSIEKPSVYVESQVRRLCEQGWAALLPRISGIEPMAPTTLSLLETAMLVERAVSSLLNRGQFPNDQWRQSPQAMGRFRKELIRRLQGSTDPALTFRTIVGGPSHLPTLELILAKEYPEELRSLVEYLIEQVPSERMLQVFRRPNVSNEDKIRMLVCHIHDHEGALPPGFEFLWEDWCHYATDRQPKPAALIMARVLRKLTPEDVGRLMKACPHGRLMGFGDSVMALYKQNRLHRHSVAAMWSTMDEGTFTRVLRQKGGDFIRTYPKEERGFGRRLEKLVLTIPQYPNEFSERLQWFLAGEHHMGEAYQTAVENWSLFVSQVQKVAKLQQPDSAPNQEARIRMLVSATRELARCADQAMDFPEIAADFTWSSKRDVTLRIASILLGNRPLFEKGPWEHDELAQWIDVQFRDHRWPSEAFRKGALIREKKKSAQGADSIRAPNSWMVTVGVVAVLLLVCGIGGYFIWSMVRPDEGYAYEGEEETVEEEESSTTSGYSRQNIDDVLE